MTQSPVFRVAACGRNLQEAIEWFVSNGKTCERPLVPALRKRFGLSAAQAVFVLRETAQRRSKPISGGANAP